MKPSELYDAITSPVGCFVGYSFYIIGGGLFLMGALGISGLGFFHPRWSRFVFRVSVWVFMSLLVKVVLPLLGVFVPRERSGFNTLPKGPSIIVCNHYGMLDGPLVFPEHLNLAAIMKAKYAKRFPYTILVKFLGFVPVDRNSLELLSASMEKARERLREGTSLLLFPEGTRSGGRRLLPFMEFGFRLSMDCGVPVVPVVIHMTEPFMAKELATFFPTRRNHITLRVLPSVNPSDFKNAGDMAETIRVSMIRELKIIGSEIVKERGRRG